MKNVIFAFLSTLLLISCMDKPAENTGHFNTVIGKVENGKVSIVADATKIRDSWKKAIYPTENPKLFFKELKIEKNGDQYFLQGRDSQNKATARISLVLENEKLYEVKKNGHGYTTMCQGCNGAGCQPTITEEGAYCTKCDDGKCTKTSTMKDGAPIIEI